MKTAVIKPEAISLTESKRLIALEHTIEAGQKTFIEVGTALAEIRDSRLYRADHDTFEAYCRAKWGWSANYGRRLIESASVTKSVPIGTIKTESQARELAKVEPAKRAEVLTKAAKRGKVTAKAIREAAPKSKTPEKPPRNLWRITVSLVEGDCGRYILHRPLKKGPLLSCAVLLERTAKKLRKFAAKARN